MNSPPPIKLLDRSTFRRICLIGVTIVLLIALCWSLVGIAVAADISREVRQGHQQTDGFLELGLNASVLRLPIVGLSPDDDHPEDPALALGIVLNGMIEWRGFFLEALYDSFGGITLGYRALHSENSALELVITNTLAELDPDTPGFESIQSRDPDAVFGLRSSWYLPNSIAQVSLLSDISDTHNGFTASVQWGKAWQVRNWNMHAMAGMRHFSNKVTNHFFGVSTEEVSARTPFYAAKAGTMAELDLGAAVPLNEHWLFRTGLQAYRLPDSVVDSPLTSERVAYELSAGFYYVF